jgi:hypothetical protein
MATRTEAATVAIPLYPLYSTSFTLHRLATLYHSAPTEPSIVTSNASLTRHARRLQEVLKGDVLRGVRVGLDTDGNDGGLGRVGALLECRWSLIGDEADWDEKQRRRVEDEETDSRFEDSVIDGAKRGIFVEVEYERSTYTALLLRDEEDSTEQEGFTSLPLLLTRMPGPLREVLMDYLRNTFDTHTSPLKLSSEFLSSALEGYLRDLSGNLGKSQAASAIVEVVKDIQVSISFPGPATPLLSKLDVTISRDDIPGLLSRGKTILQKSPQDYPPAQKRKKGDPASAGEASKDHPFTAALSHYLSSHLALPISHQEIRISKIACAAFVLGAEGKLKLFPPGNDDDDEQGSRRSQEATRNFMKRLFERTVGHSQNVLGGISGNGG